MRPKAGGNVGETLNAEGFFNTAILNSGGKSETNRQQRKSGYRNLSAAF
jgi:hypothetical protein